MMGRLETTIETKVSRQAHLEPVSAPSGLDYSAYVRYMRKSQVCVFLRGNPIIAWDVPS